MRDMSYLQTQEQLAMRSMVNGLDFPRIFELAGADVPRGFERYFTDAATMGARSWTDEEGHALAFRPSQEVLDDQAWLRATSPNLRAMQFAREVEDVYYLNHGDVPWSWLLVQDPEDFKLLGYPELATMIYDAQQNAIASTTAANQRESAIEDEVQRKMDAYRSAQRGYVAIEFDEQGNLVDSRGVVRSRRNPDGSFTDVPFEEQLSQYETMVREEETSRRHEQDLGTYWKRFEPEIEAELEGYRAALLRARDPDTVAAASAVYDQMQAGTRGTGTWDEESLWELEVQKWGPVFEAAGGNPEFPADPYEDPEDRAARIYRARAAAEQWTRPTEDLMEDMRQMLIAQANAGQPISWVHRPPDQGSLDLLVNGVVNPTAAFAGNVFTRTLEGGFFFISLGHAAATDFNMDGTLYGNMERDAENRRQAILADIAAREAMGTDEASLHKFGRTALMPNLRAVWQQMQTEQPDTVETYVAMGGGDETMGFGLWSQQVMDQPEVEQQLASMIGASDLETEALYQAMEEGDFTVSGELLNALGIWGRNVPQRLGTAAALLITQGDIRDAVLSNQWHELWEAVELHQYQPSSVLGCDGTAVGMLLDLGAGIAFDPTTWLFGPRLWRGVGRIRSAGDVVLEMSSPVVTRYIDDLVHMARSTAYGALEFLAAGMWLDDTGHISKFLTALGEYRPRTIPRGWATNERAAKIAEVDYRTVLDTLDTQQVIDIGNAGTSMHMRSEIDSLKARIKNTGQKTPVRLEWFPEPGVLRLAEGREQIVTMRALSELQKEGVKIETTAATIVLREGSPLPKSPQGKSFSALLRGDETAPVLETAMHDGAWVNPRRVLPKRLLYGEVNEAMLRDVVADGLRSGGNLPCLNRVATAIAWHGRIESSLRRVGISDWMLRYMSPQQMVTRLEIHGPTASSQILETTFRLWGSDVASAEPHLQRIMDYFVELARKEEAHVAAVGRARPLRDVIDGLYDLTGGGWDDTLQFMRTGVKGLEDARMAAQAAFDAQVAAEQAWIAAGRMGPPPGAPPAPPAPPTAPAAPAGPQPPRAPTSPASAAQRAIPDSTQPRGMDITAPRAPGVAWDGGASFQPGGGGGLVPREPGGGFTRAPGSNRLEGRAPGQEIHPAPGSGFGISRTGEGEAPPIRAEQAPGLPEIHWGGEPSGTPPAGWAEMVEQAITDPASMGNAVLNSAAREVSRRGWEAAVDFNVRSGKAVVVSRRAGQASENWRRIPNAVYVGRGTPWGNMFPITETATREQVLDWFVRVLRGEMDPPPGYTHIDFQRLVERAQNELQGQVLVCWCAPEACHAQVWADLANGVPKEIALSRDAAVRAAGESTVMSSPLASRLPPGYVTAATKRRWQTEPLYDLAREYVEAVDTAVHENYWELVDGWVRGADSRAMEHPGAMHLTALQEAIAQRMLYIPEERGFLAAVDDILSTEPAAGSAAPRLSTSSAAYMVPLDEVTWRSRVEAIRQMYGDDVARVAEEGIPDISPFQQEGAIADQLLADADIQPAMGEAGPAGQMDDIGALLPDDELSNILNREHMEEFGVDAGEMTQAARAEAVDAWRRMNLEGLTDQELIDSTLAAADGVDKGAPAIHTTFFSGEGRALLAAHDAHKLEILRRLRAGDTELLRIARERYPESSIGRAYADEGLVDMFNEVFPRELAAPAAITPAPAGGAGAPPPPAPPAPPAAPGAAPPPLPSRGLADILRARGEDLVRARLQYAAAEANRALARKTRTTLEREWDARMVAADRESLIPSHREMRQIIEDMFDDYNRKHIATNSAWKKYVDPKTGMVPWRVLRERIRLMTQRPEGVRTHMPEAVLEDVVKEAKAEAAAARAANKPASPFGQSASDLEDQLMQLSNTRRTEMAVQLPLSPLEALIASTWSGASAMKFAKLSGVHATKEFFWQLQKLWVLDKVFRVSTAMTVSFDELLRIWHLTGYNGVMRWLGDRALYASARAMSITNKWKLDPRYGGRQLPARFQERLRKLQDAPTRFKDAERQTYDGMGLGYDDIAPTDPGYIDAFQRFWGAQLQDSGFRAYLKGEDAFREWFHGPDGRDMRLTQVVEANGNSRLPTWQEMYRSWDYMYNKVLLHDINAAGKATEFKATVRDVADKVTASGGRPHDLPPWMAEGFGPVRGISKITKGAPATSRLTDAFFDHLFMRPVNYRRGYLAELVRESESQRLRSLFTSQNYRILPDAEVHRVLSARGLGSSTHSDLQPWLLDQAKKAGIIPESYISRLVERRVLDEIDNVLFSWDTGSIVGKASKAVFPFGRPWADMAGFWGREIMRRPMARGLWTEKNFLGMGKLVKSLENVLPVNPKPLAMMSRLAATDFSVNKGFFPDSWFGVQGPEGLVPGADDMDFGSLFFLPTAGRNPFYALVPGIGPLPLWLLDKALSTEWMGGVDPESDPAAYQELMDRWADFIPPVGFTNGLGWARFLGGGTSSAAVGLVLDAFRTFSNKAIDRTAVTSLLGDISSQTATNRQLSVMLSDPEELAELVALDSFVDLETAMQLMVVEAERATALGHAAGLLTRWIIPGSGDFDPTDTELDDVWIQAMQKFDYLQVRPSLQGDPSQMTPEQRKQLAGDVRRAYFEQTSDWQRQMMMFEFPQLAVNLVGGWEWSQQAETAGVTGSGLPYRTGGSNEAIARHNLYVSQGYVRPVQGIVRVKRILGLIAANRTDMIHHVYEDVVSSYNDQLWANFERDDPVTVGQLNQLAASELGQTLGVSSGRELWGELARYESMFEHTMEPAPGFTEEEWRDLEDMLITVPGMFRALDAGWPGREEGAVRNSEENVAIVRNWISPEAQKAAELLGVDLRAGATTFGQLHYNLLQAEVKLDSRLWNHVQPVYDYYVAGRSQASETARGILLDILANDDFGQDWRTNMERFDVWASNMITDYLDRSQPGVNRVPGGVSAAARQRFGELADMANGMHVDWIEDIWNPLYKPYFGPFDWTPPRPPDLRNPDGTLSRLAVTPYIRKVVDGDTIIFSLRVGPTSWQFGRGFLDTPGNTANYTARLIGVSARDFGPDPEGALEDKYRLEDALEEARRRGETIYLVRDPSLFGYTDYYDRQLMWLFIGDRPWYFEDDFLPTVSQSEGDR
jgi:hypothetical protein